MMEQLLHIKHYLWENGSKKISQINDEVARTNSPLEALPNIVRPLFAGMG